jgi:hypothetical protein
LHAQAAMYVNYLYLSELFGKPTVIPNFQKFCGDTLNHDRLSELAQNIEKTIQREFWNSTCLPVGVFVENDKTKAGTRNVRLRYLKLTPETKWIEKFRTAIISDHIEVSELIPQERQLQLAKFHKLPDLAFTQYRKPELVKFMLTEIKKISKHMTKIHTEGDFDEIKFTAQE